MNIKYQTQMKKIFATILAVLTALPMLYAEDKKPQEWNEPGVGSWAIGITFNPVSLASRLTVQPKAGSAVNGTISGSMAIEKQLYALSQDPVLAIRAKYRVVEAGTCVWRWASAVRISIIPSTFRTTQQCCWIPLPRTK